MNGKNNDFYHYVKLFCPHNGFRELLKRKNNEKKHKKTIIIKNFIYLHRN